MGQINCNEKINKNTLHLTFISLAKPLKNNIELEINGNNKKENSFDKNSAAIKFTQS